MISVNRGLATYSQHSADFFCLNCYSLQLQTLNGPSIPLPSNVSFSRWLLLTPSYHPMLFAVHNFCCLLLYLCSSISSCKRDGDAPIKRSTTSPPLIKTNVGIAETLYFAAVSGFSSTSTLMNTTLGVLSDSSLNCYYSMYGAVQVNVKQQEIRRKRKKPI